MNARTRRRLLQNLRNETRWLQKTTFALAKAQEARAKVSEIRGEQPTALLTLESGTEVSIDELDQLIKQRIEQVREELGTGDYRTV